MSNSLHSAISNPSLSTQPMSDTVSDLDILSTSTAFPPSSSGKNVLLSTSTACPPSSSGKSVLQIESTQPMLDSAFTLDYPSTSTSLAPTSNVKNSLNDSITMIVAFYLEVLPLTNLL